MKMTLLFSSIHLLSQINKTLDKVTELMYNLVMNCKDKCEKIINDMEKWSHVKITKDVRRFPDIMGNGEWEETYYTVTCYVDGEEIDSERTHSIIEAGKIAQSYETFIKYYERN